MHFRLLYAMCNQHGGEACCEWVRTHESLHAAKRHCWNGERSECWVTIAALLHEEIIAFFICNAFAYLLS